MLVSSCGLLFFRREYVYLWMYVFKHVYAPSAYQSDATGLSLFCHISRRVRILAGVRSCPVFLLASVLLLSTKNMNRSRFAYLLHIGPETEPVQTNWHLVFMPRPGMCSPGVSVSLSCGCPRIPQDLVLVLVHNPPDCVCPLLSVCLWHYVSLFAPALLLLLLFIMQPWHVCHPTPFSARPVHAPGISRGAWPRPSKRQRSQAAH